MYTIFLLRTVYLAGGKVMQKKLYGGLKEWLLIILSVLLLLAVLFLPLRWAAAQCATQEEERLKEAYQNDEVIRLHVVANSDSMEDQAVKLRVRDALIDAYGSLLDQSAASGSEEAYRVLTENVERMLQTAAECARSNGFEGAVSAECGILFLPERQYGNIILPEGEYRAPRITLGAGEGKNWWCVLFPQLCLALSETDEIAKPFNLSQRIMRNWLLKEQ